MNERRNQGLYVISSRVGPEKEEASNGDVLLNAEVHDGSTDCRFSCPCGAVEPQHPLKPSYGEDNPIHYLVQYGITSIRMALGRVDVLRRVECRRSYMRL